jgi:ribosomal protein L14
MVREVSVFQIVHIMVMSITSLCFQAGIGAVLKVLEAAVVQVAQAVMTAGVKIADWAKKVWAVMCTVAVRTAAKVRRAKGVTEVYGSNETLMLQTNEQYWQVIKVEVKSDVVYLVANIDKKWLPAKSDE